MKIISQFGYGGVLIAFKLDQISSQNDAPLLDEFFSEYTSLGTPFSPLHLDHKTMKGWSIGLSFFSA